MSAEIRTALADAANTVLGDGRCSPYYRSSARPGDAWVSFARRDRGASGLNDDFLDSWEIRVSLHQSLEAAEVWVDNNADALAQALAEELIVTAVIMVTLVTDQGNVPGLVVEGVLHH